MQTLTRKVHTLDQGPETRVNTQKTSWVGGNRTACGLPTRVVKSLTSQLTDNASNSTWQYLLLNWSICLAAMQENKMIHNMLVYFTAAE